MDTILVVEDDVDLLRGLEMNLAAEGFRVLAAPSGEKALEVVAQESLDLIILDIMLPGMDGMETCRLLRERKIDVPIIMLTARAEEVDRVKGLESGADDYVTKPFSPRELIARIHACLRRRGPSGSESLTEYRFNDVEIDFLNRRATRGGRIIDLRPKEVAVLQVLISHRGEAISREQILKKVWGNGSDMSPNTVDYHVRKLREKLEADPRSPRYILSVYGEGYRFVG